MILSDTGTKGVPVHFTTSPAAILNQAVSIIVNLLLGYLAQQQPFALRLGDKGGTGEDIWALESFRDSSRN
jgi:hypothetical protein